MREQFLSPVLVGTGLTAVLFLPLLVWQYRRYGRFAGVRMLWYAAAFIYASAIVAFTVFPLPDFSPDYCAASGDMLLLDPLRFPRDLIDTLRHEGLRATASDWLVWEVALNIVLFLPFGFIARRLLEWSRPTVILAAFGTSLLIEATQLTGNWGLAPCSYRFADTTDLFTNTLGAVVGVGLEIATPRLMANTDDLKAHRALARPVTRRRRWLGMALDGWYHILTIGIAWTVTTGLLLALYRDQAQLTAEQTQVIFDAVLWSSWAAPMALTLLTASTSNGASLGQRTVYLQPVPRDGRRSRRVLRALAVQGVVLTGVFLVPTLGAPPLALLWALTAVTSVAWTPRGLSCLLAGCDLEDSREDVVQTSPHGRGGAPPAPSGD